MSGFPRPDELDADVVLYVTAYCGYCRAAERHLKARGTPFTAVDVTRDPAARRWLVDATGRTTVPQIFIHGRSIGGYDDMVELDEAGHLDRLLAP